jgi:hypothetical protein
VRARVAAAAGQCTQHQGTARRDKKEQGHGRECEPQHNNGIYDYRLHSISLIIQLNNSFLPTGPGPMFPRQLIKLPTWNRLPRTGIKSRRIQLADPGHQA